MVAALGPAMCQRLASYHPRGSLLIVPAVPLVVQRPPVPSSAPLLVLTSLEDRCRGADGDAERALPIVIRHAQLGQGRQQLQEEAGSCWRGPSRSGISSHPVPWRWA